MTTYDNVGVIERVSKTTWRWRITDYSEYARNNNNKILSPMFIVEQSDVSTKWRLEAYPNGANDSSKNFLSVFLKSLDEHDVPAIHQLSVLSDTKTTILESIISRKIFSRTHSKSYGYSKFLSTEYLTNEANRVLIDDILVLQCRIFVDADDIDVNSCCTDRLKSDLERLFENEKHSDVTFTIGRKKMHLHKAILASRSPVFQAMFEHDMKENQQNTVKITDIKFDAAKELCRYMYSGKVNNINSLAKEVLYAADKYQLNDLKLLCAKSLSSQLKITNAVEYMALAWKYNIEYFKTNCLKFVKNNAKAIVQQPSFVDLDKTIQHEVLLTVTEVRVLD